MADETRMVLLPNQNIVDAWEPDEGTDPFLITLQCVARWADRCAIWPLGYPGVAGYEGPLPGAPQARAALIARAWHEAGDWAEREYGAGYRLAAALLWAGDEALLDNHDATWVTHSEIYLTPERVEELRECWGEHSLRRDLYRPGQSRADQFAAFIASRRMGETSEHDPAHS